MHWSIQKSAQNDGIKGEFEGTESITFVGAPEISIQEALKKAQKSDKKDVLDVAVNDPLDGEIKGAPKGTPEGGLKDTQQST